MTALFIRLLGPLFGRLALYGGIAVILGGAYWYWHHHVEQRGYNRAIEQVREQDRKAIEAGAQGVRSVRSCRASGGMWNSATGECDRRGVSGIPPS